MCVFNQFECNNSTTTSTSTAGTRTRTNHAVDDIEYEEMRFHHFRYYPVVIVEK
jgi:hypothetical protein